MINFYDYYNKRKLDGYEKYYNPIYNANHRIKDVEGLKSILHMYKRSPSNLYWLALQTYRNDGKNFLSDFFLHTVIDLDRGYLVHWAQDIMQSRWVEVEHLIAQCPSASYEYACRVVKGRFELGEEAIKKSPEFVCRYAEDIIKAPWYEAEQCVLDDPTWCWRYGEFKRYYMCSIENNINELIFNYEYSITHIEN